jgi:TolB-like protein
MHAFWARLKQRKLVQWALAYLAGAWLLLQVLHLLGETYAWPPPLMRAIPVLLGFGLLGTLVVAWYHGERGRQRVSGPELLLLGALLVVAGGAVWLVGAQPAVDGPARAAGAAGDVPRYAASVAVLPFDNLDGDAASVDFAEGITIEIIDELAKVAGLKVISRTSVLALRGSRLTLPQIADTLGVRHVVEGAVRRMADSARVRASLIDPQTDTQLWAATFDRRFIDITRFSVQEEIARQVSSALLREVDGLRPRGAGSRTDRAGAYEAYLRGTSARLRLSRENLLAAIAAFEEAIAIDPAYAPAHAGLSKAHADWGFFAYSGGLDPYASTARALVLAEQALALDSTLAEAHAMRGYARMRSWLPIDAALRDIQRALSLAPNTAEYHLMHGVALAVAGRFDQAVRETETAVLLDPLAPGHHDARAMGLTAAGRYDEALREARIARALEPGFPSPRRQEARALLLLGRHDECAAMDVGPYLPLRAMCLHAAGDTAEARVIIDSLAAAVNAGVADLPLHAGALAGEVAEYHAWLGDVERTLHWLERSAALSPTSQFIVTETATYARVRADPHFRAELDRIRRGIRARVERAMP